jgi:acyl carrier protein
MSRYISPGSLSEDDAAQPIVHFDATEPRKQQMRRAAEHRAAPVRAIDAGNVRSTETGAAPEKSEPDPARDSPNGVPSELTAFLTELHQYFDEYPVNSIARFPILSRVAAFLQEALSPAPKGNRLVAEDERPGTTRQSQTTRFERGQDLVARPTSEPDEEADAKRAVLAQPQALEIFMIDFVVEQTGYPREVVELDADLEADLGIDSIKKAQLFAELRDYFGISPNVTQKDLTLDDFPTLRHVLNFIRTADSTAGQKTVAASVEISSSIPGEGTRLLGEAREDLPELTLGPLMNALATLMVETGIVEVPAPRLTRDTRLIDDLGLDSVMILKLATAVEREFGITLNLDELRLSVLNSAGAFASLIEQKLAAQQ